MQQRPSRRSVLASAGLLAVTGLAGCTGGDTGDATRTDDTTRTRETTRSSTTSGATTTPDTTESPGESVDWDDVADFRTWLTDYSTIPESNHRFDYQEVDLDTVLSSGRLAFLDVSTSDVDGALFQSANAFFLGSFDQGVLVDAVESSEDHEVTGEYEGYATAEATESGTELLVGGDAVAAGSELSAWVDAHNGDRERLEEVDPVFTHIFERLPDREFVTAQYDPPTGGEIDTEAIYAWGTSMPSLETDAGTWVYALDPASEEVVAELESDLAASAFVEEVTDVSVDDRFATFTATTVVPD